MGQQTGWGTRGWSGARTEGSSRLRVVVESADPALAVSEFRDYDQAGLDVALCPGAPNDAGGCPVLRGEPCELVEGADAVLSSLGPHGGAIVAAARARHPGTPVVVRLSSGTVPSDALVPDGCGVLPATSSVNGQIEAVRRAALAGRRNAARPVSAPPSA